MKSLKAVSKTYTLLLTIAILAVVAHAFPIPYSIVANVQTHFITNNANTVTYPYVNVKCPSLVGLKCQQIINGRQIIIKIYQEQPKEEYISKSKEVLGASLPHMALDTSKNVEISKMYRNENNSNLSQDKESKNMSLETNKSEEYISEVEISNDENPSDVNSKYDKNLSVRNEYGDDANEYGDVLEADYQEVRGTDDGMGETKKENKLDTRFESTDFDENLNEKNENNLTQEDTADEERVTYDLTEEEKLTKENNEHLSTEEYTTASILSGKWWAL